MILLNNNISNSLDFGKKWYGVPCSDEYWKNVNCIIGLIESEVNKGINLRSIYSIADEFYLPILTSFIKEIQTQIKASRKVQKRLAEYLIKNYYYSKLITLGPDKSIINEKYNIYGSKFSKINNAKVLNKTPIVKLPKTIYYIGIKPKSKTTVLMCLDNGWQVSFKIRLSCKEGKPIFNLDIHFIGIPTEIVFSNYY